MKNARRWKLSSTQWTDIWSHWKAGQSLHESGRPLGESHVVISVSVGASRRVLTLAEREDISCGIASGCSMLVIAQGLSRASSTVSRAVARHVGRAQYRAHEADQQGLGLGPAA